jgi:hypothetical protein
VEAITWWGFPDGGWLNAPSGLVRVDGSTKPAYDALHRLVKGDWWLPPTTMVTDDEGKLRFNGFFGEYTFSSGEKAASLHLATAGKSYLEVRLGDRRDRDG